MKELFDAVLCAKRNHFYCQIDDDIKQQLPKDTLNTSNNPFLKNLSISDAQCVFGTFHKVVVLGQQMRDVDIETLNEITDSLTIHLSPHGNKFIKKLMRRSSFMEIQFSWVQFL